MADEGTSDVTSAPEAGDSKTKEYSEWLSRVQARKSKFEKGWWKRAEKAQDMYDKPQSDAEKDQVPFNILYANTEILLPSLYSSTPRPDVTARDGTPPEPAQAAERLLTVFVDDNTPGGENFDCAVEGSVLSALVPGCGGVRIRHFPGDSMPVRWEEYKYNQLVWGYAKKWSRVPWVSFLHPMTKAEIVREFAITDEQRLKVDKDDEDSNDPTVWVYEVWIKATKEVLFLCEEWEDVCLRAVNNDPLKLAGFYPTPGLLTLVRKPSDVDPVPLFDYYANQAEELNRVTVRLNKVLSAIRVKGVYHPLLGDTIKNMLNSENGENDMVATDKPLDMSNGGGFDKFIWMLPIEKLITVAQQLYQARQAIQQVIYQITGLADIVRGASVASETATAQELKSKWGTVRLRRMQRTVQIYVRALLRLAVDAATTVMRPEDWAAVTGLQFPFNVQKQQAVLAFQQQAMLAQQSGQQPPPPPPIVTQMTWEDIVARLADDRMRAYTIDIETMSTVDNDASADKQEVVDFMTAFASLTQGLAPLTAMGPAGIKAAKTIVLAVARRFKLGREVEAALKGLPESVPTPPPDASQQKGQVEAQVAQADAQAKSEANKLKAQVDQQKANFDMADLARKDAVVQRRHEVEMQRLEAESAKIAMMARMPMSPRRPA